MGVFLRHGATWPLWNFSYNRWPHVDDRWPVWEFSYGTALSGLYGNFLTDDVAFFEEMDRATTWLAVIADLVAFYRWMMLNFADFFLCWLLWRRNCWLGSNLTTI